MASRLTFPFVVAFRWIDWHFFAVCREIRLSYLPPLMIYVAAGVSGLTAIVGTFFVKDYLGLSAAFLAGLGFWAGIPWVLKMPLGHLVDLFWQWKSILVFVGAGLLMASLGIMIGLISHTEVMRQMLTIETWYVASALLAPTGYVLQDVVADAMTVEAVPRRDVDGNEIHQDQQRLMHTTMQTLGRVAIIGGSVAVALINIVLFRNVELLAETAKAAIYSRIYQMGLVIPLVSVAGVVLAILLRRREVRRMIERGFELQQIREVQNPQAERPDPNWWILGGSLVFVSFTLAMGVTQPRYNQEVIFVGSLAIVVFLIVKLAHSLEREARRVMVGTAVLVFVYRALPGAGAGSAWWMIDELAFDQQFLSVLSLIGSCLTLAGMFVFRRFMAEKSMVYIIGFLTVAGTLLMFPNIALFYGVHEWTSTHTGGVVDARFIALIDTALESPLGQIAMIPMLAWIASSAPKELKATYFAVMASFTNLALSLSQLGTKYLNRAFTITREVRDRQTDAVLVPADYSDLGRLLLAITALGLLLPLAAILLVKLSPLKAAGGKTANRPNPPTPP